MILLNWIFQDMPRFWGTWWMLMTVYVLMLMTVAMIKGEFFE